MIDGDLDMNMNTILHVITILDKLASQQTMDNVIKLASTTLLTNTNIIINHNLDWRDTISGYARGYQLLHNNNVVATDDLPAATVNNMRISSLSGSRLDDNIITALYPRLSLITKLNINNNIKVTTCAPFARTLHTLSAKGKCALTNDGLKLCTNITSLNINNNVKITTCEPFASTLRILFANVCKLSDSGLSSCIILKELWVDSNENITTCETICKIPP